MTSNNTKHWKQYEEQHLLKMSQESKSIQEMANEFDQTESAIKQKLRKLSAANEGSHEIKKNIFEGRSFYLFGRLSMTQNDVQEIITSRGGTVVTKLTASTDYFISLSCNMRKKHSVYFSDIFDKAKVLEIPFVEEKFIHDSVKQHRIIDIIPYKSNVFCCLDTSCAEKFCTEAAVISHQKKENHYFHCYACGKKDIKLGYLTNDNKDNGRRFYTVGDMNCSWCNSTCRFSRRHQPRVESDDDSSDDSSDNSSDHSDDDSNDDSDDNVLRRKSHRIQNSKKKRKRAEIEEEKEEEPKKKRKLNKGKHEWNEKELAEWIGSLGNDYKQYRTRFEDAGVNGAFMNELDKETLSDIVTKKLHCVKILFEWKKIN